MKKLCAVLLVLLIGAAAFADHGGPSLGASYIVSRQQYTTSAGASEDLVFSGVGVTSGILTSAPLGFALDVTLAWLVGGCVDGAALDMGLYSIKVMFDFLAGIGYQLPIAPGFFATFTLGPHANGAIAGGGAAFIDNAIVAGIGATARLEYMLTGTWGLYVGMKGTCDFLAIENGSRTTFNNGFVLAGSLGISLHTY